MSAFHAVPTCYTTLTSVGMLIPTECKCHIMTPVAMLEHLFLLWLYTMVLCMEEGVERGGVRGRKQTEKRQRETWLVSHQAWPVHQGDRSD